MFLGQYFREKKKKKKKTSASRESAGTETPHCGFRILKNTHLPPSFVFYLALGNYKTVLSWKSYGAHCFGSRCVAPKSPHPAQRASGHLKWGLLLHFRRLESCLGLTLESFSSFLFFYFSIEFVEVEILTCQEVDSAEQEKVIQLSTSWQMTVIIS